MTILEQLFEKGICFAVVKSSIMLRTRINDMNAIDYFILAKKQDVKGLGFRGCDNRRNLVEYDLTENDILEFKDNLDKFVEVVNTNSGRVYELKDNSFKDYIRNGAIEADEPRTQA